MTVSPMWSLLAKPFLTRVAAACTIAMMKLSAAAPRSVLPAIREALSLAAPTLSFARFHNDDHGHGAGRTRSPRLLCARKERVNGTEAAGPIVLLWFNSYQVD